MSTSAPSHILGNDISPMQAQAALGQQGGRLAQTVGAGWEVNEKLDMHGLCAKVSPQSNICGCRRVLGRRSPATEPLALHSLQRLSAFLSDGR
eukprot:4776493-Prymnesium_polylepis.1